MKPIVSIAVLAMSLTGGLLHAQDKADKTAPPKKADFATLGMKFKMDLSQKILAGLALEDYTAISENAKALKGLNTIEEFVRERNPAYRTQLQVFQFASDELVRHAEGKNIDGCTLAFTQMTISCVNCHKQLRKR